MPARVVRVEGNKLWIRVKEEPTEEQPARDSRHSSRESRPATRHLSRTREEAPADTIMEQDPHPRVFEMAPQAAGGAEGLRTEFHVALGGSTYHTAAQLADDAAILEKMGRDRGPGKEQGTFRGLGNSVPVPPTAAAPMEQRPRPGVWSYFLNAYRIHADLRINPSLGKEEGRGSNGWLEESDDESDIWSEVEPEWKRYWNSPPSATTPDRTQSG
ncbi:hypothetical protein AALP_AAs47803U000100 [Arabis alpina]|uniref:Uncharacterized protein n=1 Tax=Arabis alpina TaxID=50452 RepID=A0A087G0T8_ARAAL|nr:hypothetical protein AALP_AAs47803U000100 [Arabis alpina]